MTGKTFAEQGAIIHNTPKTDNYRKTLLEESKDHMVKIAKQMTTSHVSWSLNVLRELIGIANGFSDILYDEQELRQTKDKTLGT